MKRTDSDVGTFRKTYKPERETPDDPRPLGQHTPIPDSRYLTLQRMLAYTLNHHDLGKLVFACCSTLNRKAYRHRTISLIFHPATSTRDQRSFDRRHSASRPPHGAPLFLLEILEVLALVLALSSQPIAHKLVLENGSTTMPGGAVLKSLP